ncbi:DUF3710 domain-containing protein [Pseudonocardia xinjiangensis]
MARRNRAAVATKADPDELRTGGALALEPRDDDVPATGPYDGDDLDPEITDAAGLVDFGAVRVPVPMQGTVAVEPTANGRMQAVHVALPEGRLSVSALAAPKSSKLWPELAREIDASLREGGATVRSFQGQWGRELHATSGAAKSVFVGVDGSRWMLYGVATGPANHAEMLDAELRRMLRATVVVRGRAPYPVRTVLPLVVPEHLAEAMAASEAAKAEAAATDAAPSAVPTDQEAPPPPAAPAPPAAAEPPVEEWAAAGPPADEATRAWPSPARRTPAPRPPAPRRRPSGVPAEEAAPAAWERNAAAPPEQEAGAPLWADPVQRIADAEEVAAARRPGFDEAPTEVWGALPADPAEHGVADARSTGSWPTQEWRSGEPDRVQESGDRWAAAEPASSATGFLEGFPTQPWAFDPRLEDAAAPDAWSPAREDLPEPPTPEPAFYVEDVPTDPWPLAERYRVEPAPAPAEQSWPGAAPTNGYAHPDDRAPEGDAGTVTGTGGRRRLGEPVAPHPDRSAPDEPYLPETGEYAVPDQAASSGYFEAPSGYAASSGYFDAPSEPSGYAAPVDGGRRRAPGTADDAAVSGTGRRRAVEPEALTSVFPALGGSPAGAEPLPGEASDALARPARGRHAAPDPGEGTPETTPLQVFVAPSGTRPSGRHRRPDE